jgi:hypothetical protein
VIADVCAPANTNGGTIYVGVSPDPKVPPVGVENISETIEQLRDEIAHKIAPPLDVDIDALETQGKPVIRIQVPRGNDLPYAIDDNKIYVRDESETTLAVRDEIVRLVLRNPRPVPDNGSVPTISEMAEQSIAGLEGMGSENGEPDDTPESAEAIEAAESLESFGAAQADAETQQPAETPGQPRKSRRQRAPKAPRDKIVLSGAPRTGVEILGTETRKGEQYHIMRDLRNGNIVKNVTRSSARRLWHYAITEREANPVDVNRVQWIGDLGLWKRYKRAGVIRYDLVQRDNGNIRVYYGVTDDGMHGNWQQFISDDAAIEEEPADEQPQA